MRAAVAAVLATIALLTLPMPANAAPDNINGQLCDTVLWGFLGSQRRTLCDTPVESDGGWSRKRSIWVPAHYVPITTSCSGSRYVTCNSYGGNYVPFTIVSTETYDVHPDNVLPDEPGHLG